jgi:hypothetical protein
LLELVVVVVLRTRQDPLLFLEPEVQVVVEPEVLHPAELVLMAGMELRILVAVEAVLPTLLQVDQVVLESLFLDTLLLLQSQSAQV